MCLKADRKETNKLKKSMGQQRTFYKGYSVDRYGFIYPPYRYGKKIAHRNDIDHEDIVVVSNRGCKGVKWNNGNCVVNKGIHVFRTKREAQRPFYDILVKVLCQTKDLIAANEKDAAFMKVTIIDKV